MTIVLIVMALAILGLGLLNLYQARRAINGVRIWASARRLIDQAAATNRKSERILAQIDRRQEELESALKAAGE